MTTNTSTTSTNPMKCGRSVDLEVSDEHRQLADHARSLIEEKAGQKFDEFNIEAVKVQLVAGSNYFMSLRVGEDDYVHARVFKALPHQGSSLTCHSVLTDKTSLDELEYF